jgi:hypothetical protein
MKLVIFTSEGPSCTLPKTNKADIFEAMLVEVILVVMYWLTLSMTLSPITSAIETIHDPHAL